MLKIIFWIIIIIFYVNCAYNIQLHGERNISKKEKFFPLWGVIRIPSSSCNGTNDLRGTCLTRRECTKINGIQSGTCARNFGTCCIIQQSCGTTTNINCTYFVNPGYPRTYAGGNRCTITINKCDPNICQLRLDFVDFNLAQPDGNGNCIDDFLSIMGSASNIPRICGLNTNQHIYMDFNPGDSTPIQISIDSNNLLTFARTWNIKISQIECTSPSLAPTGCLMYYTDLSGKVMSFNYANIPNNNPVPGNTDNTLLGTRELANLNYGVCVKMLPGYCSIEWSQNPNDNFSFTLTGDSQMVTGVPDINGTCTTDFIVIPNPSQNGMVINTDRFCGTGLVTTTTSSKPFVMTVVTDNTEFPDVANRGFCLNYRQVPCS